MTWKINLADKTFVPEFFPDSKANVKELIHKMELNRVHMALMVPCDDGLPRYIIVMPHNYEVKAQVMARAREISDRQLQDHKIQILADISPATI